MFLFVLFCFVLERGGKITNHRTFHYVVLTNLRKFHNFKLTNHRMFHNGNFLTIEFHNDILPTITKPSLKLTKRKMDHYGNLQTIASSRKKIFYGTSWDQYGTFYGW